MAGAGDEPKCQNYAQCQQVCSVRTHSWAMKYVSTPSARKVWNATKARPTGRRGWVWGEGERWRRATRGKECRCLSHDLTSEYRPLRNCQRVAMGNTHRQYTLRVSAARARFTALSECGVGCQQLGMVVESACNPHTRWVPSWNISRGEFNFQFFSSAP